MSAREPDPAEPTRHGPPAEAEVRPARPRLARTAPDRESLWYYKENDLSEKYHTEPRFALRKSFWLLVVSLAFWSVYLGVYGSDGLGGTDSAAQTTFFLAARLSFAVFVASFVYWELYRRTHVYRAEGFRLLVSKGICIKTQASLPLLPITEIYVRRAPLDILFGLYNVDIATPVEAEKQFARIEGLCREHAYGLHHFLTDQLNRQVFVSPIPEYNFETGERTVVGPVRNEG